MDPLCSNSRTAGPPPLVSVLMPVHNGERFLPEALNSILTQTWRNMEIVVVDDGSTDGTSRILRRYRARDQRLRIIAQPKLGLVSALNCGLAALQGKFVARFDADDIALPRRIDKHIGYLRTHPHVAAVGSQIIIIDHDGRALRRGHYPVGEDACHRHLLTRGAPLCHSAVTFRSDAVRRVGKYREAYQHAEDVDLWLRLVAVGTIDNHPEVLLRYRLHGGNTSVTKAEQQAAATALAYASACARAHGEGDPTPPTGWPLGIGWPELENLFPMPERKALTRRVYFRTLVLNGAVAEPHVLMRFRSILPQLVAEATTDCARSELAFMLTRAAMQLYRHGNLDAARRTLLRIGYVAPRATLSELRLLLYRSLGLSE